MSCNKVLELLTFVRGGTCEMECKDSCGVFCEGMTPHRASPGSFCITPLVTQEC